MRKPFKIPYIEIIKDSIKFAVKRRYLWWFGLFASLAGGGGMNYYYSFSGQREYENTLSEEQITSFISNNLEWIIAIAIILVLIFAALTVLGFLGRGALIDSIKIELDGKSATFKSGMRQSLKFFWRLFFISLSIGIFILSLIALIGAPIMFLFFNGNYAAGIMMSLLGILILFPFLILAGYVRTYGYLYAVIGKLNFWQSIENAYLLFRRNLRDSIIMGLIFIALNFILGIAIIMAVIPIAIVFFVLGLLIYLLAGKIGVIILAILGAFVALVLAVAIRAIYEVFTQTVWIKFFHEIGKAPEEEPVAETVSAPIPEKPMPIIESEKE